MVSDQTVMKGMFWVSGDSNKSVGRNQSPAPVIGIPFR
jgi:hypothetical protein